MAANLRDQVLPLSSNDDPFQFQITDFFVPEADKSKKRWAPGAEEEEIREFEVMLYGCTMKGESVTAVVTGYRPYFYLRVSDKHAKKDSVALKNMMNQLYIYLFEGEYQATTKGGRTYTRKVIPYCLRGHLLPFKLEHKKEFMGFTNQQKFPFVKITCKSLRLFNTLKYFFSRPPKTFLDTFGEFKLYESNIDPMLRFIHDTRILPCGWVELKARHYSILEDPDFVRTNRALEVDYRNMVPLDRNTTAPLIIASFDIECTSSHGDFPVAIKDYTKLAKDLVSIAAVTQEYDAGQVMDWIERAYGGDVLVGHDMVVHRLYAKTIKGVDIRGLLEGIIERVVECMRSVKAVEDGDSDEEDGVAMTATAARKHVAEQENKLRELLNEVLPKLKGDEIIQIGTTVHRYGSDEIIYRNIVTLKGCEEIDGVEVEAYNSEAKVLQAWKLVLQRIDPDILMGYNIFGFDMPYIWDRAMELGLTGYGEGLGRLSSRECIMLEQKLSSAALGDNVLHYFDMDGVVLVDMYKVMQRGALESYKLDFVAKLYLGDQKNDIKPHEIFEKFKGSDYDRKVIAEYCLQDCALVNRLFHKLKVLENNNAMGNVCLVPLSYLFMRGQGVKIFSLVAQFCKDKEFAIPVLRNYREDVDLPLDDGYEGAIVLQPKEGMYLQDAITVLDYSSLYPSSMIERNLSHDCYVNDPVYDNLPGVDYCTVTYDIYEGVGDKKVKVGEKSCKFVQGEKGLIPQILMKLLKQRKNTRKKIEYESVETVDGSVYAGLVTEKEEELVILDVEKGSSVVVEKGKVVGRKETYNMFEQAVLDALQLAYKVTANSLYGQIGSRVSPIYLKDIAACTTATGRERILMAKKFVEEQYGAEVIYGDTDSIFCKFTHYNEKGEKITGRETLPLGIKAGQRASKEIKSILPPPQCLEYEKTFFPFIIFSKKRYVGLLYEDDANKKPKQKSMGIVLKRRDNAPIVKKIYGGIIDILLNKYDLNASVDFIKTELGRLVAGEYDLNDLIVTKTLKANYKDRSKIAHCVLADRMGVRDAGNKPQANDRIPYVYIKTGEDVKLQGDKIEHPDYIRQHNLVPDYQFYITNQLMKPISQLYALCVENLPGYSYPNSYWVQIDEELSYQELYKNDTRRQNRIQSLREQEVVNLVFDPFLEKKKRARAVGGGGTSGTRSTKKKIIEKEGLGEHAPLFEMRVVEKTDPPREWVVGCRLEVNGGEVWKGEYRFPKYKKTKAEVCNAAMTKALGELEGGDYMEAIQTIGVRLKLDKYYTQLLKKLIDKQEDVLKDIEQAQKENDLEKHQECMELMLSVNVANRIIAWGYSFVK